MIKATLAAVAAAPLFAGAAMAGPYVNIEANSGFTGADYTGTTTDAHVRATLALLAKASPGMLRWVLASSPLTVLTVRLFSLVKTGASVAATERLSIYGEVSFATGIDDADNGYGTKVGATFSF